MFNQTTLNTLKDKGFSFNLNDNTLVYRFKRFTGYLIYYVDKHNDIIDIEMFLRKDRYNVFKGTVSFNKNDRPSFLDTDFQRDMFNCIHQSIITKGQAGFAVRKLWELGDEFKSIENHLDREY